MRKIELLAPARDAECGIEAIKHGADAVYIGGPSFGARAAAANAVADIARLCDFAHLFEAKIYVALNTILYEDELHRAEQVAADLYEAGADALIVQDMALLKLSLPPIALHASTQMNNRTVERAQFLEQCGFSQIVLARELPLATIRSIHEAVSTPLEAFVHGALCVSYSGQCYASQHCFQRSANRGCCAQFCRLGFDLIDGKERVVQRNKHLLSLRDMNRSEWLEQMMDAGISSFKIEGRLKDVGYVKNVTAFYRQRLDDVLQRRSADYVRASRGRSTYSFTPNVAKSFNRGFTDYFLQGKRSATLQNIYTPKAMGEEVGRIARVDRRRGAFSLALLPNVSLAAGDGLCFISGGQLHGFRVNRVETWYRGDAQMLLDAEGAVIYRNNDYTFNRTLTKPTAERTLWVDAALTETSVGYALTLTDEAGVAVSVAVDYPHEAAKTPQANYMQQQLERMGGTPFRLRRCALQLSEQYFIPASVLGVARRTAIALLVEQHKKRYVRPQRLQPCIKQPSSFPAHLDYTANVANSKAREFYADCGARSVDAAYELAPPPKACLMTCKYCLRYALGACLKRPTAGVQWEAPLYLRLTDGRCFRLAFDCDKCEMKIYATT